MKPGAKKRKKSSVILGIPPPRRAIGEAQLKARRSEDTRPVRGKKRTRELHLSEFQKNKRKGGSPEGMGAGRS